MFTIGDAPLDSTRSAQEQPQVTTCPCVADMLTKTVIPVGMQSLRLEKSYNVCLQS